MKRLALIFIALLAACAPADADWYGEGVVTDLRYDDPDTWTTYDGPCVAYDKDGNCTMRMPREHHDPAHWMVQVTERSGRDHRIAVDETTYNRCRIGARWIETRCQG